MVAYESIGQLDGCDDDVLDDIEHAESQENKKEVKPITIVNTNARSLCPKIESLIDCLEEMDAAIGIVTETWLSDGPSLARDIADLEAGAGVSLICRNRRPGASGVAHGGVAIAFKPEECKMQEVIMDNPDNYEVLVATGTMPGFSRKVLVVAAYLPPGYDVARGRGAVQYIEDVFRELKRRFRDPFVVLGGTSTNGRYRKRPKNSLISLNHRWARQETADASTGYLRTSAGLN